MKNITIHRGEKYTIETDGQTAFKSDGQSVRTMRFYPERDAGALAGEIDELTAWQILKDISCQAQLISTPISPEHIFISDDGFLLSEWSGSRDFRLFAPEGYDSVWALGATVFFIFLGCHVFQGLGGGGQTKTAPVPVLRRELPELSSLIKRCLDYNPANRPSLKEIAAEAEKNLTRCRESQSEFPPLKIIDSEIYADTEIDKYWPEEMC